jgi:lysophospholipase L1-like esterase
MSEAADAQQITVFLAGDSTMATKLPEKRPETGWGEKLQQFFSGEVKIDNRALNGRSTRTFISEGVWQKLLSAVRPGDYVFIQFGHNDESKAKTDRYTSPEEFRNNLIRFVTEARSHEATPVLLTSVARRSFDQQAKFYDTHGEYPDIVRSVAREQHVVLLDAQRASEELVKSYGAEESKKLFLWVAANESSNYPSGNQDNTHFSPLGAELIAKSIVGLLRQSNLPLAKFLLQDSR